MYMKRWINTTTKVLTWFVIINGEIQIYLSYVLGYLSRPNAMETLAITIATEIIAPLALLFIKTTIENIFEKNEIFKKNEPEEPADLGGAL